MSRYIHDWNLKAGRIGACIGCTGSAFFILVQLPSLALVRPLSAIEAVCEIQYLEYKPSILESTAKPNASTLVAS
jgi:hypothetical protein